MRSALDTNVLVLLLGNEPADSSAAWETLVEARRNGAIVICGAVYSELLAHPRMTPATLTRFLNETAIDIDFEASRGIWHEAGLRYARYSSRRRKTQAGHPRRLLADFVIGAHALLQADCLITFDSRVYRDFPELRTIPGKPQ